jgi:hypothetical protein
MADYYEKRRSVISKITNTVKQSMPKGIDKDLLAIKVEDLTGFTKKSIMKIINERVAVNILDIKDNKVVWIA